MTNAAVRTLALCFAILTLPTAGYARPAKPGVSSIDSIDFRDHTQWQSDNAVFLRLLKVLPGSAAVGLDPRNTEPSHYVHQMATRNFGWLKVEAARARAEEQYLATPSFAALVDRAASIVAQPAGQNSPQTAQSELRALASDFLKNAAAEWPELYRRQNNNDERSRRSLMDNGIALVKALPTILPALGTDPAIQEFRAFVVGKKSPQQLTGALVLSDFDAHRIDAITQVAAFRFVNDAAGRCLVNDFSPQALTAAMKILKQKNPLSAIRLGDRLAENIQTSKTLGHGWISFKDAASLQQELQGCNPEGVTLSEGEKEILRNWTSKQKEAKDLVERLAIEESMKQSLRSALSRPLSTLKLKRNSKGEVNGFNVHVGDKSFAVKVKQPSSVGGGVVKVMREDPPSSWQIVYATEPTRRYAAQPPQRTKLTTRNPGYPGWDKKVSRSTW